MVSQIEGKLVPSHVLTLWPSHLLLDSGLDDGGNVLDRIIEHHEDYGHLAERVFFHGIGGRRWECNDLVCFQDGWPKVFKLINANERVQLVQSVEVAFLMLQQHESNLPCVLQRPG